jgi:hypothetical protein
MNFILLINNYYLTVVASRGDKQKAPSDEEASI